MVVAKLRIAVEDPVVAKRLGLNPIEVVKTEDEPFFLDGPVGARVAVVDREIGGTLSRPVRWRASERVYDVGAGARIDSPAAIAVSAFGTALKTLAMFERPDVLGHPVTWAFGSPQLLIVPRAGIAENAFYDRAGRCLQFFYFHPDKGKTVYTALSRDIVAHEMGHAILDGLAPALYDALLPQSLALHESIGDLAAIVMSLQSRAVRTWLIDRNGGRLSGSTPVSRLAEEFGEGSFGENRPLRDAANNEKMRAGRTEPHSLSEVLTGAVWKAMSAFHRHSRSRANRESYRGNEQLESRTLGISALQIGRIIFRALDYIPPAETSFADFAKALIRADEIVFPGKENEFRDVMKNEFVKREVVGSVKDLDADPGDRFVEVDLAEILHSDWAAYAFAEANRKLLRIPEGVPFRLFPRRDVYRRYYIGPGEREERREIVFQLTWEAQEENPAAVPGDYRGVFQGTTLVLSEEEDRRGRHRVLSCLTSSRGFEDERSEMVLRLVDEGSLRVLSGDEKPSDRPLAPQAFARLAGGVLRVRGTARLLHLRGYRGEE